jgi:structural maintenance of chromosome 4
VLELFTQTQETLAGKAEELAEMKAAYDRMQADTNTIRTVEVDIHSKLEDLEKGRKETHAQSVHWGKQLGDARVKLQEALGSDELPPLLNDEQLAAHTDDDAHIQVTLLETTLAEMKPDMGAIEQWTEKDREYSARAVEVDGVTGERDAVRKTHDDLRKKRLDEFMAGFNTITMKLKEMYQMITLGGDAELELVDSLDPFSEGIVFSVRPPKKSWKNISNLSGGEKTLSSLSLVFALHHYKPTPLYVMDEIDAALGTRPAPLPLLLPQFTDRMAHSIQPPPYANHLR